MTETTKETIKFARSWLENAEKYGDPNAPTTGTMTALARAVMELADEVEARTCTGDCVYNCNCIKAIELNKELAALKEKYRWRKQSEEPHQTLHEGEYIEAIVGLNTYVLSQRPFVLKCWKDGYTFPSEEVGADSILYWRPLDLPEEDGGDNDKN